MKFIDEYRDADAAKQIAEAIARHIIVTEGKKEAAPSFYK